MTKFFDSKSDFHRRKRIKRTKDSPKPDILNINDLEKDKKQLEEPGINTFKAGDYLD